MQQTSYAYAVGRIKVLENKLLSRDKIDRMLEAPSAEEAIKVLAENEYGQGQDMANPHDYEKLLSAELEKTYQLINTITPNKAITDLFLLRYDIHNLKVLLKARFLGNEQDQFLAGIGSIPVADLKNAVLNQDYENLPPFLARALTELEEALSLKFDPMKIDLFLDRAYYDWVFTVCNKGRNAFLRQLFIKRVDLTNIETMFRVRKIGEGFEFLKKLLIPHGSFDFSFFSAAMDQTPEEFLQAMKNSEYAKVLTAGIQDFIKTGSLTLYERLMDDYIMGFLKSHKYNPLGIEPVIGYLLAKENEIKLVRMIMVGKINRIPNDRIRERLRDVYV